MPSKIKFPLTKLSLKKLSEFRPDLGVIEERVKEYNNKIDVERKVNRNTKEKQKRIDAKKNILLSSINKNREYFIKKQEALLRSKLNVIKEKRSAKIISKFVKENTIKKQIYVLPENSLGALKAGLIKFKGFTVIVIYNVDGFEVRKKMYRIPISGFNMFWENIKISDWGKVSDISIFDENEGNGKCIIYKEDLKVSEKIVQSFRDGISHCLFTPIRNWAQNKYDNSTDRKTKSRYNVILKHLSEFEVKYSSGVPEDAINEICNTLQIDIHIDLPFGINKFIVGESIKKRLKVFKFMNTRLNHIELNEIVNVDEKEEVSFEKLWDIKRELDNKGDFYTYKKNNKKISNISTLNKEYTTLNEYGKIVNEWYIEQEKLGCDFNSYKIDDMDDKILSEFIKEGTNYNSTIDFIPTNGIKKKGIFHIDMKKAYANFKTCQFYKGFLGKITDFRRTDKIEGVGMYKITNLKFPDNEFSNYNKILKIYIDNNVYCSVELEFLQSQGVYFEIVSGCWGITPVNFEFNDNMLDGKDDEGVSYYAKWAGQCDSHYLNKTFWMKASESFFNVVRDNCGDETVKWFNSNEGCIEFPKQHNFHLGHITAFITAYQRLNVLEQLLEIDIKNVVRVCVDGIYHKQNNVKLCNVFRPKTDLKFGNDASLSYVSESIVKELEINGYDERKHFNKELHLGEGGSGKTHYNLIDKGLIRIMYLAPSWKLARNKKNELGVNCSVWARALTDDPERIKLIRNYANVLLVDEVSMLTENQKVQLFNTYNDMKIIMCGDLGYQLPSIDGVECSTEGFDNIVYHKTDYRCKCNKLKYIKKQLRKMINDGLNKFEINNWVIKAFREMNRVIKLDDLKSLYNIDDMILSGTNEIKNYYTEMFQGKFDKEKYYVKDNNKLYCNGDIVITNEKPDKCSCEIRHCFTTHSIQGETAQFKLFIDSNKMFDSRMFYTAISRAKSLDQIYIIDNDEIIKFKYEYGKIYKIVSKNGVYIGSTIQNLNTRMKEHQYGYNNFKEGKGKYITSYKSLDDDDVKID